MSVYGGKNVSPGKAMARTWFYSHIPRGSLYSGMHIVIASRDCGDIKYLLSIGVNADQIIACDIDPLARIEASKYGVIVSDYPRIEDTVRWAQAVYGNRLISVNVDLCCSLLNAAESAAEVLEARIPFTSLTYQRGRDRRLLDEYNFTGIDTESARLMYLRSKTKLMESGNIEYQSFTRTSIGASMGVVMWVQRRKAGRPKKVRA